MHEIIIYFFNKEIKLEYTHENNYFKYQTF